MSLLSALAEILFVGHSLVGPDMPNMLEFALRSREIRTEVSAQVINGSPLSYAWDHSAEAEGVDARVRLAEGNTEVLVLTEAIPLENQIAYQNSAGVTKRWYDLAIAANPDTQVYLYETWNNLQSGTGNPVPYDKNGHIPWRERLDIDLPLWRLVTHDANATRPEGAKPIRLIPAGQAMALMYDEIALGRVPGMTSIRDLFSDDIHLNDRGLYLVTMVHFAAITGQDPAGLPARLSRVWKSRDTAVTQPMAEKMQAVAWAAVQAENAAFEAAALLPEPEAPVIAQAVTEASPRAPPAFGPGIANPSLGMGLAGVNDWSVQMPFLDLMKTARPWVGHLPGQWGGWGHEELSAGGWLDPMGWPKAIPPELTGISTLILTDLPEAAASSAGRYRISFDGEGTVRVEGRAQNLRWGKGEVSFDYTPGEGAVLITITRTDPFGRGDHIRNIRVVKEGYARQYAAGEIFNPAWLQRIRGLRLIRFMDWMETNNSSLVHAADRPRPEDYTWARVGVPVEVMVALANTIAADPWFNMPHQADDEFVQTYARAVRDGLSPDLRAHVEYSNEVWNWQFAQAGWADARAKERWGQEGWMQLYGLRAAEVANIWADVFGAKAKDRLVRVVATQTGWQGLEKDILTAPLAVAKGARPPVESFDAYAVAGYFSAALGTEAKLSLVRGWIEDSTAAAKKAAAANGLSGSAATAYVAQHRFELAVALAAVELRDGSLSGDDSDSIAGITGKVLPYHAQVAQEHGLKLVMYEGGTHVVGTGPLVDDPDLTAFYVTLNYSDEMGGLYRQMLGAWQKLSDAPFNAFVDVYNPGRWGSWGALRHLDDDNPRWRALAEGCVAC